ncbi:MAG TPA: nitrous oxide reductase family maturation protein NosD, partial [Candidatus Binatia bacterium]|nr:nitrous oxide reductase family maturation protein NosD [Candidatus Binatia bacterium]
RPMGTLARVERRLAPLGMLGAFGGILLIPWARRRPLRVLLALPALLMPLILLVDLQLWMDAAVNERDPNAALNLTVSRIDPKLFGAYEVGQFKVATELGGGFYLAGVAGLLGLGLAFATPLARRRRAPAALLAAAALGAALAPGRAPAAELVVGTAAPDVATTLAAARDGDTVVVPPGVHHEHPVVDRAVQLVGRPGAVLDGDGAGTVLRIRAAGAEVRGLTIRNGGEGYDAEDAGIRIDHARDVRIADTRVEDTLFGIFVVQGDRCAIERTTIVGKDLPHVRRGDGIRLWYSAGCRLVGNRVERSRDVIIWYSAGTVVEDNVVRASRYGLHYMYSNDNVFRRNRFEDDQVGAAIMYSRGIELTENSFSYASGPAAYGVLLKDSDDVFVVGNRFVHDTIGLFVDGVPQSRGGRLDVRGNLIARGRVGIALQPLSRGIRLWENAFVGNDLAVQVLGTGTAEGDEWAVDGRGNYWSDGVVYDRDGDGVSELPYRLESTFEALADRHPVLAFFAHTPPAEAIDLGARLFPVFAPRPTLVDPHPLVAPQLAAWTRGEDGPPPAPTLAGVGAGLFGVVALAAWAAREPLA